MTNSNLESSKEKLTRIKMNFQNIGRNDPNFMKNFQNFMGASKKPGALSTKMKEIIGVALSVKAQCERCIVWHVKSAMDLGATKQEIIEAAEVAIMMAGGPGLMYMEDVLEAIEDFETE
ncbi:MAG: carboxymuconolactone decarboxylase family protein [Promethearchaeota archaeon]